MPKVFVGMSGGVDSSTAAYLLQKDGYSVEGVTFDTGFCLRCQRCRHIEFEVSKSGLPGADEAMHVCRHLGIPHHIVRLGHEFQSKVVRYFIDSYLIGFTPNPCVMCNRYIKFGALLDYALSRGADFLATGHYVRTAVHNGSTLIRRGNDPLKDQSYFLAYVEPAKLGKVLFPLGEMNKPQVRDTASDAGLPVPPPSGESQDICFVQGDYRDFLRQNGVTGTPGDFILDGKVIGRHTGIPFYSFGQRRGHGVAVGKRVFVRGFDTEKNQVLLGDIPAAREFTAGKLNIFTPEFTDGRYEIQVRYQSKIAHGSVRLENGAAHVMLDEAHEIVAPGQFAVFYKGDYIYAAGQIERVTLL
ncbi:MAG: tRNA 2-thiouridine(34) synthase MnmA [Spirochaetes bacterium GWF1_51_8]|nr:MAG: tRNA 2-thiouridine(34) synthase MnmA [Spirochaetes bacterium GWF1_51_8]